MKKGLLISLALLGAAGGQAQGEEFVIAEGGEARCRIVVSSDAPSPVKYAAEELQKCVREMSGAALPLVTDAEGEKAGEICLGASGRTKGLADRGLSSLGEDGYLLEASSARLLIAGNSPRAVLYGVYGLLEDRFGCRWFTPTVSRIPKIDRLAVESCQETHRPALAYREVMLFDAWDPVWYSRNRLNTTGPTFLKDRYGDSPWRHVPNYSVHTFGRFISADEFYDTHPEYFSEVDAKRVREKGQLCCTNDEVARIISERAIALLRAHPEARVISVSQNDGNTNYCRCPRCAAIDEEEKSHAGQVLFLVNRVAEAVEKELPGRYVQTLAYEWSRQAPRTMKVRDNVIVWLSTIRCSFSQPLASSEQPANRQFRRDLQRWVEICRNLWVWDYGTYFSYYLIPFPNWKVVPDNIRFFAAQGVRGVQLQDNWQSPSSGLSQMNAYVAAKHLWNPDYGRDRAINEYLEGVYGPAAPYIRRYVDLLADKVDRETIPVSIYGSRTPPFLPLEALTEADSLWEKAEEAVSGMPEFLRRVRVSRLSVDYAIIEHYRFKPNVMVFYEGSPARGKVVGIKPEYEARVRRFLEVCAQAGITHIREGNADCAEYVQWLKSLLPQTK